MIFAATSRVFWPRYAPRMRLRSGLRPELRLANPSPAFGLRSRPAPLLNSFRRHWESGRKQGMAASDEVDM